MATVMCAQITGGALFHHFLYILQVLVVAMCTWPLESSALCLTETEIWGYWGNWGNRGN